MDVTIQARGAVFVEGQRVGSQLVNQSNMSYWSTPVRLLKTIVLQPQTEFVLWGVNEDPQPDRDGILEPNTMVEGLLIAGTLVAALRIMTSLIKPIAVLRFLPHLPLSTR